jgi:hypothetical protein
VSHARAALGPGRQRGQHNGFLGFAMPQQKPTGFLVASRPLAMRGIFLKQTSRYFIGQEDALETLVTAGRGRG